MHHPLEDVKLDKLHVVDSSMPRSKSYFIRSTQVEKPGRSVVIGVVTMEDVTEAIMKQEIDDEVDALRKEQPTIYGMRLQNSTDMIYTTPPSPHTSNLKSPSAQDFSHVFFMNQQNGSNSSSPTSSKKKTCSKYITTRTTTTTTTGTLILILIIITDIIE